MPQNKLFLPILQYQLRFPQESLVPIHFWWRGPSWELPGRNRKEKKKYFVFFVVVFSLPLSNIFFHAFMCPVTLFSLVLHSVKNIVTASSYCLALKRYFSTWKTATTTKMTNNLFKYFPRKKNMVSLIYETLVLFISHKQLIAIIQPSICYDLAQKYHSYQMHWPTGCLQKGQLMIS